MTVSKTPMGLQVMKDRSINLSMHQRSALILCDGKRAAADVVRMAAGAGVTMQDLIDLGALGLIVMDAPNDIEAVGGAPIATPAAKLAAQEPAFAPNMQSTGIDFPAALNAAITLCSNIGFKGFGLNMALTSVDSLEKLQKLAPEIRRATGDSKYKALHALIFGKPL